MSEANADFFKEGKLNPFSKPGSNSGWGINGSHEQHVSTPAPADNPGSHSSVSKTKKSSHKGGGQY